MLERKTDSDAITAFALLAFFVGLVVLGFMLTPVHAQSDLYKLATLKPAYDDRFQKRRATHLRQLPLDPPVRHRQLLLLGHFDLYNDAIRKTTDTQPYASQMRVLITNR